MPIDLSPEQYLADLTARAEVKVERSKPLRLYLNSADSVFKQACIYEREGNVEDAYVLFLKYSNLLLREVPKHPEYDGSSPQIQSLRGNCVRALDVCESSRPHILRTHATRLSRSAAEQTRLRALTAQSARQAQEEAERVGREEEARRRRMQEIRVMEGRRTYELQQRSKSLGDGGMGDDYLDLVEHRPVIPAEANPVILSPPPPIQQISSPAIQPVSTYRSESGAPLRALSIPSSIISTFLSLAAANTRRDIETCGVLAGRLSHSRFTLTHLIVPKQEGTRDTCSMVGEEEVLAVQDQEKLLTLGWIHTHPTQECFMSSVDLHTHFPYQLMMAEAVAIVVAPTQSPNFGIFRLTDPPGLGVIASCPLRGFHPHHCQEPIYRETGGSTRHAHMDDSLPLKVIDLRSNK